MNWKEWLKYDLYKKIWFWAGRPFTYIRRKFWHHFEILNIYFYLGAGFTLGFFFWDIFHWVVRHPVLALLVVLGANILGVLWGHFFWNKGDNPCEIDEDTGL